MRTTLTQKALIMPNYRRYRIEGGTYFFTLKTENNLPLFQDKNNVHLLGQVIRETKRKWPFEINAIVLLPDHLHALWILPQADADYSKRWAWLKREFTVRYLSSGGHEQSRSNSQSRNRRRGVWQRRFWEHMVRDEDDFDAHFDYIHWNPVKHQYVLRPCLWKHSSFHQWVKRGVYPSNWGGEGVPETIRQVNDAGE